MTSTTAIGVSPIPSRVPLLFFKTPKYARSVQLGLVDSTGLKIFGEGEWLQKKHKAKAKRKSWRKLHLGLNLATGEIVCSELERFQFTLHRLFAAFLFAQTQKTMTDASMKTGKKSMFSVIWQIPAAFCKRTATRAMPSFIPPPKTAVLSAEAAISPNLRDKSVTAITGGGRIAWQASSGYNQRSRAETQMGRWKMVIGPKLKARSFPNQKTEARIGSNILNKMTGLGSAKFEAAP